MTCCLMAPSHYLNQCWWWSVKSKDNQMTSISQDIPQPSIIKISLKITRIKISFKSLRSQWVNVLGVELHGRNKFASFIILWHLKVAGGWNLSSRKTSCLSCTVVSWLLMSWRHKVQRHQQGVWKKFSASGQSLKPKMFFFHLFI